MNSKMKENKNQTQHTVHSFIRSRAVIRIPPLIG